MKTKLFYWMAVTIVYWAFAVWLLYRVFVIFVDGSGASATFHWGSGFLVANLPDFQTNLNTRILFLYQYWIAACVITSVGCGLTPWLVRLWKVRRSRLFLVSAATTLTILLVVGAISDVGIAIKVWNGPHIYNIFANTFAFLKVLIPVSLLAGILALLHDRSPAGPS